MAFLGAKSPAVVSGHHAEARGGRGCAPEEYVPTAAASWGVPRTAVA